MRNEILEIRALVDKLRALDAEFRVFGAKSHRYRVGPILSESTIQEFEAKHDIHLPEDFRLYLKIVGDGRGVPTPEGFWNKGGAGPNYGIYSLSEMDVGTRINRDFPFESRVELACEPSRERWSDDVPGALEISTPGCAGHTHLIVKGPQYGTIWEGWEYDNFVPAHDSFCAWMRSWAEEELKAWDYRHLVGRVQVGMSKEQVVSATTEDWAQRTVGEQILMESASLRVQLYLDADGIVTKVNSYFWK